MHEGESKAAIEKLRECESRFLQMAENIRDVFFLVAADGQRVLYLSPAYEAIWGRSVASVYADPQAWIGAIHPDDRASAYENYEKGMAGGSAMYEFRIVRPDGSIRWIEARDFPVHDATGAIVRITGVARDITEKKQMAQDLLDSNSRLDSIVTSAMDAIVSVDESQHIVLVNAAAGRLFGYQDEEMLGQPLDLLLPARFQAGHAAHIDAFGREGTTSRHMGSLRTVRGVRRNGEEFTLEASISRDESTGRRFFTAILRDVTERDRILDDLHESERRFSEMLGNVELVSVMLDRQARITFCNEYLLRLTGWQREEVMGRNWIEVFIPPELDLSGVFAELIGNQPSALHHENEILTRKGERRMIRWSNSVLRSGAGDVIGIASIGEDITEQKLAEIRIKRLNRVYAVLSQINTLIVHVRDRDALFRGACSIAVGRGDIYMAVIAIRDPVTQRVGPVASAGGDDTLMGFLEVALASSEIAPNTMLAQSIREGAPAVSNDISHDPGVELAGKYTEFGVHSMAALPLIVAGETIGSFLLYATEAGFFHDEEMSLLVELTGDIAFAIDHIDKGERLDYLAYHDALTGLANQALFVERLQQRLLSLRDSQRKQAVFLLDIERFKTINDTFGRNEGDGLLKQIAARLVQVGGGSEGRFARVAADRFAIVATDFDSVEQIGNYVEQRLDETFRAPFRVSGDHLRVSAKVGIALFPDDGNDAETLLRHAEAALKKAKSTGERYLFYTQKMTERVAERLSLENRLREALENDQFVLHYQPKIHIASGRLTGAEALIRWNDPRTGLVPPMMFIPILEETGLIHPVGRWAMRKAIEDYLRWRNAGLPAVRMAVNVSPLQLRSRGFVAEIEHVLGVDAKAAAGMELEITESVIMEDVKHNIALLQAIRAMGVTVAIDDFGTGFSSLSYLSKLPIDTLKIDRAFVIEMTASPDGLALVSTIINLARSLQFKVVAEGVETEEQKRLLRLLSCDEMQGYLFSRPVPAETFEEKFLTIKS